MYFPVSGVDTPAYIPPLAAFLVSAMTSGAGISGAFLLLPFQVSVLGFTGPAVTPTNLIFNVMAAPGGVYSYARQKRMHWPLALILIAGSVPGMALGAVLRVRYLLDPRAFKLFAGSVLLYLGIRLVLSALKEMPCGKESVHEQAGKFNGKAVAATAFIIGVVGGIYGVGGGALLAPFLVAVLHMPVCAVAGASLLTTLIASITGVASFELIHVIGGSPSVRPDWLLGAMFGLGGLAGTYTGARIHRHLPERWLRLGLGVLVLGAAVSYVLPAAGRLFT